MRFLAPLTLAFLSLPAAAADVEVGVDADVALAYGTAVKGLGAGLSARAGIGPNPLKLGPTALALSGEAVGSFWAFPDATDGTTYLLRGTVGGRGIFTLLWIRKPGGGEGGRGRGIRLDLPVAIHAGTGSVDGGTQWTPTADASVGIAIGLLPVELGFHIGGGAISANRNISLEGTAWVNTGLDVSAVF
ncbi:MAG: hypothetical protein AB8H79_17710 [Myxococcota bacterium]